MSVYTKFYSPLYYERIRCMFITNSLFILFFSYIYRQMYGRLYDVNDYITTSFLLLCVIILGYIRNLHNRLYIYISSRYIACYILIEDCRKRSFITVACSINDCRYIRIHFSGKKLSAKCSTIDIT